MHIMQQLLHTLIVFKQMLTADYFIDTKILGMPLETAPNKLCRQKSFLKVYTMFFVRNYNLFLLFFEAQFLWADISFIYGE